MSPGKTPSSTKMPADAMSFSRQISDNLVFSSTSESPQQPLPQAPDAIVSAPAMFSDFEPVQYQHPILPPMQVPTHEPSPSAPFDFYQPTAGETIRRHRMTSAPVFQSFISPINPHLPLDYRENTFDFRSRTTTMDDILSNMIQNDRSDSRKESNSVNQLQIHQFPDIHMETSLSASDLMDAEQALDHHNNQQYLLNYHQNVNPVNGHLFPSPPTTPRGTRVRQVSGANSPNEIQFVEMNTPAAAHGFMELVAAADNFHYPRPSEAPTAVNIAPPSSLSGIPEKELNMTIHACAVMDPEKGKVYRCNRRLCTKTYKNPNGLKYHLKSGKCEYEAPDHENDSSIVDPMSAIPFDHYDTINADGYEIAAVKRTFICQIPGCGKKYKNLNGLKYHGKVRHPEYDFVTQVRGRNSH